MFQLINMYDEPDDFEMANEDETLDVKITSDGYLQFQWSDDDGSLMSLSPRYAKDLIARMAVLISETDRQPWQDQNV